MATIPSQSAPFSLSPAKLPLVALESERRNCSQCYFFCKRVADASISLSLLLLLSPLFAIIAILIKLDSPGTVLFVQDRVGARRRKLAGKTIWQPCTFRFYKFRSMVENADPSIHEAQVRQLHSAGDQPLNFKLTNDSRITRFGRLLRRTSCDEFPQLLNVLKGDMSLVGPRPVPLYEAALYDGVQCERLAALPGITGLWQTKARCQVPYREMIRLDIDYVRTASFWLDIKLILLTVPAVLSGKGAN